MDTWREVLALVQPYGILRNYTPDSLASELQDVAEEFEEQLDTDRQAALALLIAQYDPNGLHNPAEKTEAVAKWQPPLIAHLGLQGVYDRASHRMRIESSGTTVTEETVEAPCHAAAVWNRVIVPMGFEMLDLDTGGDDHSFVVTSKQAADGLREAMLVRLMKPCPRR